MNVQIQINNSASATARFVTWAPSPCRVRMTDPSGAPAPNVAVTLSFTSVAGGGAIGFANSAAGPFQATLAVTVPTSGASVPFFVAGKFGSPSVNNGDVKIVARAGATQIGSVTLMVRVRKNANTLAAAERDRFVAALAKLNNQGLGRFTDFRDMHRIPAALAQAHGAPGFLPWHRAYLLDLERELQAIDPSVALHYWRFDHAAPNIFTKAFLGTSDLLGTVSFNPSNPLQFWKTDGVPGINRRPLFNTATAPPGLRTESATLALSTSFSGFKIMEGNPHGSAHTRFGGLVSDPATAPRDPLFFLLHCNVDRLWAKWQRNNSRFNPATAASFDNSSPVVGHRLNDTMWPWNGVTGGTRPPTAPGGTLATSPCASSPGVSPRVRDMLDFHGKVSSPARMGFSYDDVPFS